MAAGAADPSDVVDLLQQGVERLCGPSTGLAKRSADLWRSRMKALCFLLGATISMLAGHAAYAAEADMIVKAREIEQRLDARVGLAVHDTGSGRQWLHNADERFPMASTFKVLACGTLLRQVDEGGNEIDRTVPIREADLIPYAPVTQSMVGQQMSLGDLCAATMRTSDNVAANKVLGEIGGPDGVTAFLRSIGDGTTRLDRNEPDVNEATPGDPRDTTTPAAMAVTLRKLVLNDALSPASRERLTAWLISNEVGGPLLRAGIPQEWRIGDRSGAGGHGTRGIVAIIWPPEREPIAAAIYITGTDATMEERNAAIAELGAALAAAVDP
jgi:beta-lactamase class A